MAREKALVLCVSLFACNGGGANGSATQGGVEASGPPPGGVTTAVNTTSGESPESPSTGAAPGVPTTGPSVTTAPGPGGTGNDETGNDATGNGETGNPGTGDGETGDSGQPGTTDGPDTGAPGTGGTTSDGSAGPNSGSTGGDGQECVPLQCEGKVYDCGDCTDNDGDGKVDLADPECVSPCDDRENSFATGLPGDNVDPCKQDCFFDGNSGAGSGDCQWNLKCDPEGPGGASCPYDPNYNNCPDDQPQTCIDTCQVPNGCDCFGCCAVKVDGQTHHVYLGDPDCSLDQIDQCTQCTLNDDCDNPCVPEECELCFAEDELPPGCEQPTCEQGLTPCEVGDGGGSGCPEGFFCSTGCCMPVAPG